MKQIGQFEGYFHFLSNFFIEPDGTTVEHEFQAAKTHFLDEKVTILGCSTPGQAKRAGGKKGLKLPDGTIFHVTLRRDWEEEQPNGMLTKVNFMRDLVFRKFWDHPDLAMMLADTGDAELIEGNYWHDNIWGNCTCSSCARIEGTNFLGLALMDVRAVLLGK